MLNMYSVLLTVASLCLLLLTANASPIRTTTVYEALQITPSPLVKESHPINFLSLSSELCQDNVKSVGCEPPPTRHSQKNEAEQQSKHRLAMSSMLCADNVHSLGCEPPSMLTKRSEPAKPTSLGYEHCVIKAGVWECHRLDPEWPRIWRYPTKTISRRAEDLQSPTQAPTETASIKNPHDHAWAINWSAVESLVSKLEAKRTPTVTSTETSSIEHPQEPSWPNILALPTQNVPEVEDKPASTPTPTETLSNEARRILGLVAFDKAFDVAVAAAAKPPTLSARGNDEEQRVCHKDRDCQIRRNTFPPSAQTPSHKNDEAAPTATQTSSPIQTPTPTTTTAPCHPLDSECPNPDYHTCDPTEHECFWDHAATKEEPSPTPTPAMKVCPEHDPQCLHLPTFPKYDSVPPMHPAPPAQPEKGVHTSPEKLCGGNGQECRKDWHFPPTKIRE